MSKRKNVECEWKRIQADPDPQNCYLGKMIYKIPRPNFDFQNIKWKKIEHGTIGIVFSVIYKNVLHTTVIKKKQRHDCL